MKINSGYKNVRETIYCIYPNGAYEKCFNKNNGDPTTF